MSQFAEWVSGMPQWEKRAVDPLSVIEIRYRPLCACVKCADKVGFWCVFFCDFWQNLMLTRCCQRFSCHKSPQNTPKTHFATCKSVLRYVFAFRWRTVRDLVLSLWHFGLSETQSAKFRGLVNFFLSKSPAKNSICLHAILCKKKIKKKTGFLEVTSTVWWEKNSKKFFFEKSHLLYELQHFEFSIFRHFY